MDAESAADTDAMCWEFAEVRVGRSQHWKWSLKPAAGSTPRASQFFNGYGEAVTDAIENGFRPSQHDWVVVGASGSVHLYKGSIAGRLLA